MILLLNLVGLLDLVGVGFDRFDAVEADTAARPGAEHPPSAAQPPDVPASQRPVWDGSKPWKPLFEEEGIVARWDPCGPILWALDTADPPYADFHRDVEQAAHAVADASGLDLVYVGTTDDEPDGQRGGDGPDVLVRSAPIEEDRVAGRAGVRHLPHDPGTREIVGAEIEIDSDSLAEGLSPGFGPYSVGSVIMHEFGHAMGLGHVEDPGELMYPLVTERSEFGRADLEGLRALGAAGGCMEPASDR